MKFFYKLICKKKGHYYKMTGHIESDGWGNEWHWKKCGRCGQTTFDEKQIK